MFVSLCQYSSVFPSRCHGFGLWSVIVTPIVGVCNCSMFCCTLLYVHSSIAIILMGKRELIALLNLSSWCLVMVEQLFLAVPQGCLQFVIGVFPDHTLLLFFLFISFRDISETHRLVRSYQILSNYLKEYQSSPATKFTPQNIHSKEITPNDARESSYFCK